MKGTIDIPDVFYNEIKRIVVTFGDNIEAEESTVELPLSIMLKAALPDDMESLKGENVRLEAEVKKYKRAIEDIKKQIHKLTVYHATEKGSELISKRAVFRAINFVLTRVRESEDES